MIMLGSIIAALMGDTQAAQRAAPVVQSLPKR
jgi:hypothetical protein